MTKRTKDAWRQPWAWADHEDHLQVERWLVRGLLLVSAVWFFFAHGWKATVDAFLHPATIFVFVLASTVPRLLRTVLYCFDELLFDEHTGARRDYFVTDETLRQIENTESEVIRLRKTVG